MKLREIVTYLGSDIQNDIEENFLNLEVKNLQYDSRQVQPKDVFIALEGTAVDGHKYINAAVSNGAAAVIAQKAPAGLDLHTPVLMVKDTREVISKLAEMWFDFPDKKLHLVGVTGTNGKTTTTLLINYLWKKQGIASGLLGTISNLCGDRTLPSTHTTPEPLQLAELLDTMVEEEIENVVMEVSSHALKQKRVDAIHFDGGIFTNLTQDHLDFHRTFEDYIDSKKILFEMLNRGDVSKKFAVVNADDPKAEEFIKATDAKVWTFAVDTAATLQAIEYHLTPAGTGFTLLYEGEKYEVSVPLSGKFNVYNTMAAMAALLAEGADIKTLIEDLKTAPQVAGRFERVIAGQNFAVVVDYAHTPDGLENVLKTSKELAPKSIITVFGCGGDRDKTKRPLMAEIAALYSDYTIITSDNPRTEDPMAIIADVEAGIKNLKNQDFSNSYAVQPDRKAAIEMALKMAKAGDLVMIAGKGHEDYQLVNGQVLDFDDRLVAKGILQDMMQSEQ